MAGERRQRWEGSLATGTTALSRFTEDDRLRRAFNYATLGLLFYFVTQFFWPAPPGVIVQGIVVGGLTALISFGIALIYRANRIVNFAQGDLGGAPAALMVLLIAGWRFPYFLALATGLVAAVALGVLVEFLFIRRFFRAPRLILTVATIGLSQILAGVAILLPRLFDFDVPPQSFPSPFDFSFEIAPIVFRGNDIIAMIVVAASIIGLIAFLRYTSIGIAVRASAESADRAFLLGIPVPRIHTTVWVIATVLATLGMFMRAGIMGLPFGRVLAPAILLRALAAAVIGRMENLPVIFIAACGIGIIEQSIVWTHSSSELSAPILFLVVIAALLFQRRGRVARADEESSWQAAKGVRPIPAELARIPEVFFGIRGLVALIGLGLVALPLFLSESRINLAAAITIHAMIGISLVILTGWAGQVSLGQMALVGIGAAVAGSVTSRLGWEMLLSLAIAGIAGAIVATIIGLPALRIRGLYLAVTTLAFALATSSYLLNRDYFGSVLPAQRVQRPPLLRVISVQSETRYYYLCLGFLVLAMASAHRIRRSRTGRVLLGIRENERAAQSYGVNAIRAKLTAFGLSGFFAAVAGGLFVHHQQSLNISPFDPERSLEVFTMVVIGGLGSLPGAILGAVYIRGISWFLPSQFRFFASGVGVLVILLMAPAGLGSILYIVRDFFLRRVAQRRRIIVPSLIADTKAQDLAFQQKKAAEFEAIDADAIAASGAGGADGPRRTNGSGEPDGTDADRTQEFETAAPSRARKRPARRR